MKKKLILLGPPGAGKGTVGSRLSVIWGLPLISSGDLLREHLKRGTEAGSNAGKYMEKGELVPDEIVIKMIEEKLTGPLCREGFIIDGFPRTIVQAEMLDTIVDDAGETKVIYLKAGDDFLVERLSLRRVCGGCGKIYHLVNLPPLKEGICDFCGRALIQRDDDKEEIIRRRLDVYRRMTAPLIEYYRSKNILHMVSGEGKLEDTVSEIKKIAKW
ncbi:MAG: adenylate kinase [Candidatus Omnitrophica bacterium]|nr:adenylate kinase [Candidatus Omnitrophota bacterium]